MIPGFVSRLQAELLKAISPPSTPPRHVTRHDRHPPPTFDRYASLRPLTARFAILNNPSPHTPDGVSTNAGKAPAFSPATMAWVGGSLAG
jgi:actin-related protein 10